MTFEQAYEELKNKFRERVEDDRVKGIDSVFLPNMEPAGPVDYILIGMEPSLGNWSGRKEQDPDERMRTAKEKIDNGFRNFCGVWILHHPVKKYLCRDDETYYVTDLAKGAMLTNSPGAGDKRKYQDWYALPGRGVGAGGEAGRQDHIHRP